MKTKTILLALMIAVISCNSNKPVKVAINRQWDSAKVDTIKQDTASWLGSKNSLADSTR